jgi:structural maintenance of chromosome 2
LKSECEKLTAQIDTLRDQAEEINAELNEEKSQLRERNKFIDSKSSEGDKLAKEKNSILLKIKELEHKKKSLNEQLEQSKLALVKLADSNEWIDEEKATFGNVNTVYDFEKQNIKEVQHRLHDIKKRKEVLSKQVDMRAMGQLAKKEDEYDELNKKRIIVLKDRATLESTIEDLEKLKMEVLLKAFDSITKDFGSIFKTLLPGAFAKLEWVNKESLLDGVEFKIAFGNVWKESLAELNDGQRSLVALSLILSLLLYKPAPLYILDEVDAALDTSHTQNIGLMIKKHFPHSQFVIVSLKDDMFSNANVLFRTKLVEGVSTVQWYGQKKRQTEALAENNNTTRATRPFDSRTLFLE